LFPDTGFVGHCIYNDKIGAQVTDNRAYIMHLLSHILPFLQNNFLEPYSRMTLPLNMGMDIDDFSGRNVDNYDNVRGHTMTSNKMSSRTISMSSSEASVDYATRMEWLNNVPDDEETREPINSSQLSYTELKEIQVSGATDQVNRARMQ